MPQWFVQLDAVWQALLAGTFTWAITAIGATVVLFWKSLPERFLDAMLGFAAGVMIAASFWSLLAPAIEVSEARGGNPWLATSIGFLLGAAFLRLADRFIPHFHPRLKTTEGPSSKLRRGTLLMVAMTLHNIPEGLAVGVAFGAVAQGGDFALGTSLAGATALAVGIGLQNLPEGIAVAVPMRETGASRGKSFFYGQASALVEPVAAVIGALIVSTSELLLPYGLAFAAGAMIFVSVEELIPESQKKDRDLATLATIVGFVVMMVLDVGLG